jgi:hypothetical protein
VYVCLCVRSDCGYGHKSKLRMLRKSVCVPVPGLEVMSALRCVCSLTSGRAHRATLWMPHEKI